MCCLLSPNLPPLKGGRVWCPTSPTTPTPRRDTAFKRKKRGVRSESAPVILAGRDAAEKRQPRAIVGGLLFAVASPPPGKESFNRRVWSALMCLSTEFCERRFRIHRPRLRRIRSLPLEGWGEDPKKIEAIIKDNAEVLAMYREEMVEKPGGSRRPIADIVSNDGKVDSGNSRAYSIARVKKDCDPDTVAEVLAGKISPNAALVRSGIRVNRGLR